VDRTWEGLGKALTEKTLSNILTFISEDAWNLVTDDGKADIADAAALLVECGMVEAAGGDATVAKAALSAAIGNWELSGKIRMAGHVDDFLDDLKVALLAAGKIALTMLI